MCNMRKQYYFLVLSVIPLPTLHINNLNCICPQYYRGIVPTRGQGSVVFSIDTLPLIKPNPNPNPCGNNAPIILGINAPMILGTNVLIMVGTNAFMIQFTLLIIYSTDCTKLYNTLSVHAYLIYHYTVQTAPNYTIL